VDSDIDIPESVVNDEEAVSLFSLFNKICIISTAVIVFPHRYINNEQHELHKKNSGAREE
jgi:hypothetical protein